MHNPIGAIQQVQFSCGAVVLFKKTFFFKNKRLSTAAALPLFSLPAAGEEDRGDKRGDKSGREEGRRREENRGEELRRETARDGAAMSQR